MADRSIPIAQEIRKSVEDFVANAHSTGSIQGRLVEKLASDEINSRVTALTAALTKRAEKLKELNKIQPDIVTIDPDKPPGQNETKAYSKDAWGRKKKAEEELANFDRAIADAVEKGEKDHFEKLKKFCGGG